MKTNGIGCVVTDLRHVLQTIREYDIEQAKQRDLQRKKMVRHEYWKRWKYRKINNLIKPKERKNEERKSLHFGKDER